MKPMPDQITPETSSFKRITQTEKEEARRWMKSLDDGEAAEWIFREIEHGRSQTPVNEWEIIEGMFGPEGDEHRLDDAYAFVKNVVSQEQDKLVRLYDDRTPESTYQDNDFESALKDLRNDLTRFERDRELGKVKKRIGQLVSYLRRLDSLADPKTLSRGMVEAAKSFPIEQIIPTPVRRDGNRMKALCPLHDEKTPSFVIYPENTWHCFGCGESGDSIDLAMKVNSLTFAQAVRSLQ